MSKKRTLSRTAILRIKATDARQEIPDPRAAALRLVIQPKPSGAKSWRRPSGKAGTATRFV